MVPVATGRMQLIPHTTVQGVKVRLVGNVWLGYLFLAL